MLWGPLKRSLLPAKAFIQIRKLSSKISGTGDTIFACATGPPPCGVSVIRLSGIKTKEVVISLTQRPLPKERNLILRSFFDPSTKSLIDRGMVVLFNGPKSYTGEDSAEFHVHGSNAVLISMYSALSSIENVRLARPGEFTKRAFYNGKLDLTAADGLHDLINAETELQRKQALLQMEGHLKNTIVNWKSQLISILVDLEAFIEFSETDGASSKLDKVYEKFNLLRISIEDYVNKSYTHADPIRNGIKTVLLGKPNVGKSSLFNVLAGEDHAIVSNIERTTRDAFMVNLDIAGYPVKLVDTAGVVDDPQDTFDVLAQKKTVQNIEQANLIIYLINMASLHKQIDFLSYLKSILLDVTELPIVNKETNRLEDIFTKPSIIAVNMSDKKPELELPQLPKEVLEISCKTLHGIDQLQNVIGKKLKEIFMEPTASNPFYFNDRQRANLMQVLQNLNKVSENNFEKMPDITVLHLRKAMDSFDKVIGDNPNEQILDEMFSKFCIGK